MERVQNLSDESAAKTLAAGIAARGNYDKDEGILIIDDKDYVSRFA